MNRIRVLWEKLRSSLWFVPTLLVLGAVILAILMIEAESYVARQQLATRWPRLFGAGAEGARGMLSAIASSMITVVGVTFSITIVAFALASSQYTSRILRNFMRDPGNQTVLGVLLGVFAYCLVVLRTIRGGEEEVFVPSLAILGAVLLALLAIGFLVFFIHHVAEQIQASSIIPAVAHETIQAIDRLYRADSETPPQQEMGSPDRHELSGEPWNTVVARKTGYVQAIEGRSLLDLACKHQMVVRMEKGVGEFVIEGTPLVSVTGKQPDEDLTREVNAAYTTGRHRTIQEDPAYGIRQIVDIALKALSPAINDTTTALICIDHLGAILVALAGRRIDPANDYEDGQLRVIRSGSTYEAYGAEAFDQIRQNGKDNPAVLSHLLETLALISRQTQDPERLEVLRRQAEAVVEAAEKNIPSAHDRVGIKAALKRGSLALGGGGDGTR